MKNYDIIVIGTGAGTKLVQPVAKLGFKVAVIEKDFPGGTCLNRGCIPSKMLIYPTELIAHIHNINKFNIQIESGFKVDFSSITKRIRATITEETDSIPPIYEKNPNVDYYHGKAEFISPYEIRVQGNILSSQKIILGVGARPFVPDIPGLSNTPYWTSTEALFAETLPKSILVLGAGFIGCELGSAYALYGSKVTLIARTKVLSNTDSEIQKEFLSIFSKYVDAKEETTIQKVEFKDNLFHSYLSDGTVVITEKFLVASGVTSNADTLNLSLTSVELDSRGYIKTNEFLETTQKGIYALGDVRGEYFFRHSANFEGEYLFESLFQSKSPIPIKIPPVGGAVFSHPQVASVGKTEEDLIREKIPYKKGVNAYKSSAMGMARLSEYGMVKVLAKAGSGELLGVHIVGEEASNLIQMFIMAMSFKINATELLNMIFIHPALPEIGRNALRKLREELSK
jgi:dihydrolipoamide dehydrogenase